jgi:hypothetical protein
MIPAALFEAERTVVTHEDIHTTIRRLIFERRQNPK